MGGGCLVHPLHPRWAYTEPRGNCRASGHQVACLADRRQLGADGEIRLSDPARCVDTLQDLGLEEDRHSMAASCPSPVDAWKSQPALCSPGQGGPSSYRMRSDLRELPIGGRVQHPHRTERQVISLCAYLQDADRIVSMSLLGGYPKQ